MANSVVDAYTSNQQTVDRYPCWFVWSLSIDTNNGFVTLLDDFRINGMLLDGFVNVSQAEAGATSTGLTFRQTDDTTPATLCTSAADDLGTTGFKRLTPDAAAATPVAADDFRLEVGGVIVGTATTPALCKVGLLLMRTDY